MAKNSESIEKTAREIGEQTKDTGSKISNSLVNLSVNIDVSDALKGLKAVQREAKNTVRALKEVEELSDKRTIDSLTDDEIFEELVTRGWELEENKIRTMDDIPYLSIVKMERFYKTQN